MVSEHLAVLERTEDLAVEDLDVLFLENVGNLVCPSGFDLGETSRWVLLSVTEGEDKPRKYPAAFSGADLAVISKIDLAGPCNFDRDEAYRSLDAVGARNVVETSATTGAGIPDLIARLTSTSEQPSTPDNPNERQ